MSLRTLPFLLMALVATAVGAAPAVADSGHWRPHLQVQVALPLPIHVAYAPAPLPPVYAHSAVPPAYYAPPPPSAVPAQQWVWIDGGFVQQSCGSRAWVPAHWELRPVASLHRGHGHRHGPAYAKAYGPRHPRDWRR